MKYPGSCMSLTQDTGSGNEGNQDRFLKYMSAVGWYLDSESVC